jgi:hypothetical protein
MPLWEMPDGVPPRTHADRHLGDWRLHHLVVLASPGGFTPVRADPHREATVHPHESVSERMPELLGLDYAHTAQAVRVVHRRTDCPACILQSGPNVTPTVLQTA